MGAGEPNTDVGFTAPVVISAPAASVAGGTATLTWTTNKKASDQVRWGLAPNIDQVTAEGNLPSQGNGVTAHSVAVGAGALQSGKTYLYQLISRQNTGKDGMNNVVMDGYQAVYNGSFGA